MCVLFLPCHPRLRGSYADTSALAGTAAKAAHRRSSSAIDDQLLDRKRLEDLRRVQSERVQREKMTRLGFEVSENLGVRLEDKMRG